MDRIWTRIQQEIITPKQAREWVKMIDDRGADGIKFLELLRGLLSCHRRSQFKRIRHDDTSCSNSVVYNNVLQSARLGLTSMTHWYGLPEALFEDKIIQDYPLDYNYNNEQHRFEEQAN